MLLDGIDLRDLNLNWLRKQVRGYGGKARRHEGAAEVKGAVLGAHGVREFPSGYQIDTINVLFVHWC